MDLAVLGLEHQCLNRNLDPAVEVSKLQHSHARTYTLRAQQQRCTTRTSWSPLMARAKRLSMSLGCDDCARNPHKYSEARESRRQLHFDPTATTDSIPYPKHFESIICRFRVHVQVLVFGRACPRQRP